MFRIFGFVVLCVLGHSSCMPMSDKNSGKVEHFSLVKVSHFLSTFPELSAAETHGITLPLPSSWSLDSIMEHALHCMDVLGELQPKSNLTSDMDTMHGRHCGEVAARISEFFGRNPNYRFVAKPSNNIRWFGSSSRHFVPVFPSTNG